MRFEILKVEHGFCAYAIGGDGSVFLFDCGHSVWNRPSTLLPERGIRSIQRFFVTNYDEDHISDLLNVRKALDIEILSRNTSLTSSEIASLKTPPISPAMKELLNMVDSYTGTVTVAQLEPPSLKVEFFHNNYPTFTDTNNLSLLTFLDVGNLSFVLGGDLERNGWLKLIENPRVRTLLKKADYFVASHHGRESGYCREVFDFCKPIQIVMSDGPIRYDTQEMASRYAQHASGGWFTTRKGQQIRKVVTTRNDGNIFWDI